MIGAEEWIESDAASGTDVSLENEIHGGAKGGRAVLATENEKGPGSPSRYIDADTELLGALASMWQDFQQMRKAADQRGLSDADVAELRKPEEYFAKQLRKALRRHTMWPWLEQYPGTGGVHVARLIARIGDPRRFPGQRCDMGHTFAPIISVSATVSLAQCPFVDRTTGEVCPGIVLPPREGPDNKGVRAMWRYFGLDGPRATAASGHKYDRLGKTAMLMPDGIADQIIKHRIEPWRGIYDATKLRLTTERSAGAEDDHRLENDTESVLRPFQLHAIARKVAVKHFAADLLMEWKRRADAGVENDTDAGPALPDDA